MKKYRMLALCLIGIILSGCQHLTSISKENAVAGLGAVTGAALGYTLGKNGEHKEVWAIGGAVAGALIGKQIGQYLNEKEKQKMAESSQKAIVTGKPQAWSNPENNVSGRAEVVSEKTETTAAATRTCRTVKQVITLADGTEKEEEITACQGPNGWETI